MDTTSRLFAPLDLGKHKLSHRVVMSPLTRFRADDLSIQASFVKDYYSQRASVPGTLLITEATAISSRAVGFLNVPGIWSKEQVNSWKEIADAVHAKGSFIFLQLWATGRSGQPERTGSGSYDYVSSSAVPIEAADLPPRELTDEDIEEYIQQYATAAKNAISAGMDGVEIHAANGYLIDQFIQASCNRRDDKWGGSIEKRASFALKVTEAVVAAVGSDRVGIKLTPWGKIQGMGTMTELVQQFEHLISKLRDMKLAFLHLANSRWLDEIPPELEDNGIYVKLWNNSSPLILEGGYTAESAREEVDGRFGDCDIAVAFGRFFISNPDLPFRIQRGIDLQQYNRDTFYTPLSRHGYIDYPFSVEFLAVQDATA